MKIQPPGTRLKDSEKTLVGRCLAGEQRAWEEVCQCYNSTIANIASWEKWRFDQHELEDVTQDIMLEIVTSLKNTLARYTLRTDTTKRYTSHPATLLPANCSQGIRKKILPSRYSIRELFSGKRKQEMTVLSKKTRADSLSITFIQKF